MHFLTGGSPAEMLGHAYVVRGDVWAPLVAEPDSVQYTDCPSMAEYF